VFNLTWYFVIGEIALQNINLTDRC